MAKPEGSLTSAQHEIMAGGRIRHSFHMARPLSERRPCRYPLPRGSPGGTHEKPISSRAVYPTPGFRAWTWTEPFADGERGHLFCHVADRYDPLLYPQVVVGGLGEMQYDILKR